MRAFLLHLTLFAIFPSSFCQNRLSQKTSAENLVKQNRWNLDCYIWSHAHCMVNNVNKSAIDFDAIDNWPTMGKDVSVSPDAKYFEYTLERNLGTYNKVDSVIVQSTNNSSIRQSFSDAEPGIFSSDSKQYVFKSKKGIGFLSLDSGKLTYIENALSYQVPDGNSKEWVAVQLKKNEIILRSLFDAKSETFSDVSQSSFEKSGNWFVCVNNSKKELLLYNLKTGKRYYYPSIVTYSLDKSGKSLYTKAENGGLSFIDLTTQKQTNVWIPGIGEKMIGNVTFDSKGAQLIFTVEDKDKLISIWYYKSGMYKAVLKISNHTKGIGSDHLIQASSFFTDNDKYIQLSLSFKPDLLQPILGTVQLNVWSYKDTVLQSLQPSLLTNPKTIASIFNIENNQVSFLERQDETLYLVQGDFAIVKKHNRDLFGDRFWEVDYDKDSNWVVSLSDGTRKLLPTKGWDYTLWFSPGGRYLVYYDNDNKGHYFSYFLSTGELKDISAGVPDWQFAYVNPYLRTSEKPEGSAGIAAWLEDDEGLLVYDNYDIWKLDLSGRVKPINVTNYYGRSHNVLLSLMNGDRLYDSREIVSKRQSLIMRAFDWQTKFSGFYHKCLSGNGDPEKLYMGPYFTGIIGACQDGNVSNEGMRPIKAAKANCWIIQRQSAKEAPNYYKTTDFKLFKRLTDFHPQNGFNWMSEDLHTFKHIDGMKGQGVLFKPEDFDSSKKYPVLIVIYGGYSNSLYQFHNPAYSITGITAGVSPIWYLQHGYLVFTPDIYVTPSRLGPEAANVIEGAVEYLKHLPYVDSNRLGCCAHSWSAKLGTYLLTHSKSFNAMGISEGFFYADMINVALSTDERNGESHLETIEKREYRFGSLWENKQNWLDHTAVLNADKANCALLLLCNKLSTKEYQNQTLQLFTAIRRLQKQAWWLQYDKGEHELHDLNEKRDYTIRYIQFFDHYLKEAPAPKWMTHGLPYGFRGIENRLELDPAGNCSPTCQVCMKWNKMYEKDPLMFKKNISEWHLSQVN